MRELPQKYEDIILPIFNINEKYVLAGSLALYIMRLMEYDFTGRTPDIDFGLKEALTEDDLSVMQDFFNLELVISQGDYDVIPVDETFTETKTKSIKHFSTKELIQLRKWGPKSSTIMVTRPVYTVDLFNSNYLKPKDVIHIPYKEYTLRVTHPSVILSHKSKYAYDPRVGKQYKHFDDIKKMDWDNYFKIVKRVRTVYDSEKSKCTHSEFAEETTDVSNIL